MRTPRQAVLLAAGPANRLLPLTASRPKGMLLIAGRPLMEYALASLKQAGVERVVIVVGAHAQKIQSHLKDGADMGLSIQYATQSSPNGTANALRVALPFLQDEDTWVVNGAVFTTGPMLERMAEKEGDVVLVATAGMEYDQAIPEVRGGNLVGMRAGKPVVGSTRVSTGLAIMTPAALAALDDHDAADHDILLGQLAEGGHPVATATLEEAWHTIVTPWDVLRLNEQVLDELPAGNAPEGPTIRGRVEIGANVTIAPTATIIGPTSLGDGAHVGDYSVVGPYVSVRHNSVIGSHCEVRRTIINNNVLVDSRSLLRGSILDDGVVLGPGFLCHEESTAAGPVGCIVGSDARVGARVSAHGGSIIEPESAIDAGGIL